MLLRRLAATVFLLLAALPAVVVGATKPRGTLDRNEKDYVSAVAFSPDGKTLAVLDMNAQEVLTLWDTATLKRTAVLKPRSSRPCLPLAFAPDASLYVGGIYETGVDKNGATYNRCCVNVWDVATKKERWVLDDPEDNSIGCVLTPDGKSLIFGTADRGALVFDVETGKQIKALRCEGPQGVVDEVKSLAVSADGKTLAVGTRHTDLLLFDLEKGELLQKIPPGVQGYRGGGFDVLAFSPDGKRLVTCTLRDDRAQVWDPATGKNLDFLAVHDSVQNISALAFSPDGKTLAMGGNFRVELWDIAAGGLRDDFSGKSAKSGDIYLLAFSPDGKTLVTVGNNGVVLFWDVPAGAPKGVRYDTTPPFLPPPPAPPANRNGP